MNATGAGPAGPLNLNKLQYNMLKRGQQNQIEGTLATELGG